MPDADTGRALWDVTQEVCEAHGLPAYEISNHARPGGESRHNLVYWRYGDYAAIGAGAHGRVTTPSSRIAFANEKNPEQWLAAVEAKGHGMVERSLLTREEQGDEFLLMGLRLREGIDPARFTALSGRTLDPERIAFLVQHNLVAADATGRLAVTAKVFRCSMRWSPISPRDGHAPVWNVFGAGLMVTAVPLRISLTASARSFVPSCRKRKMPSAPENPDGLVNTSSLKRRAPCVRTSAITSDVAS